MGVWPPCVSVYHLWVVPMAIRWGHQMPWRWSYWWLVVYAQYRTWVLCKSSGGCSLSPASSFWIHKANFEHCALCLSSLPPVPSGRPNLESSAHPLTQALGDEGRWCIDNKEVNIFFYFVLFHGFVCFWLWRHKLVSLGQSWSRNQGEGGIIQSPLKTQSGIILK